MAALAPLPGSGRALGLDPTETPQFTSTPGQVAFTPDGSQLIVTTKNNGNDRVAPADGFLFASNAGSADESGFTSSPGGTLSLLGATGTDAGTVDASAAGGFLYVQTGGAGIVDEFSVGAAGSLTKVGSVTVPDAVGGEGIVAS